MNYRGLDVIIVLVIANVPNVLGVVILNVLFVIEDII